MPESADSTIAPNRQKLNGAHPPKQRSKPLRMNRQRRQRVEAIVDGLLRLLDEIDGDPDEEPSLGLNVLAPCSIAAVDLEGDTSDDEAWLGANEVGSCWITDWNGNPQGREVFGVDQRSWGSTGCMESDENCDWEPSLGWTDLEARTGRHAGNGIVDGEGPDDNGIGDRGGLDFDAEPDTDAEPEDGQ